MTTEPRPAPAVELQHQNQFINKRLRLAGMLIVIGVLVEGLSLAWNHPLSFLAFVGIGGLAMAVGVAVYLLALVSPRSR
jgi:hypothetical protein